MELFNEELNEENLKITTDIVVKNETESIFELLPYGDSLDISTQVINN